MHTRDIQILLLVLVIPIHGSADEYPVSSRLEFLDAIGPNRTIVIAEGEIVITECLPPDELGCYPIHHPNQYVDWEQEWDGVTLVISNVENLTIRGCGELASSLITEPRYAFVVEFTDCAGIVIENLVLGHSPGGYCENGVLGFTDCRDINIDSCDIFGCGVVGLDLRETEGFRFSNSIIRDCTYGIMTCIDSSDLVFENSVFRENEEFWGVELRRCRDVTFLGCLFEDNIADFCKAFFNFDSCDNVILQDCIIRDNLTTELFSTTEGITLIDVEKECNTLTH